MKYLTLLPFLIGATMVMPRAHAAVHTTVHTTVHTIYTAIDNEPSSYMTALVCLLLILLANSRPRSEHFHQLDQPH